MGGRGLVAKLDQTPLKPHRSAPHRKTSVGIDITGIALATPVALEYRSVISPWGCRTRCMYHGGRSAWPIEQDEHRWGGCNVPGARRAFLERLQLWEEIGRRVLHCTSRQVA